MKADCSSGRLTVRSAMADMGASFVGGYENIIPPSSGPLFPTRLAEPVLGPAIGRTRGLATLPSGQGYRIWLGRRRSRRRNEPRKSQRYAGRLLWSRIPPRISAISVVEPGACGALIGAFGPYAI